MSLSDAVAAWLRQQCEWRTRVAIDYPYDRRNVHAAMYLAAFAAYVRTLPDSDERIQAICEAALDNVAVLIPGPLADNHVSRLGFVNRVGIIDPDDLDIVLDDRVDIVRQSIVELYEFAGEEPPVFASFVPRPRM